MHRLRPGRLCLDVEAMEEEESKDAAAAASAAPRTPKRAQDGNVGLDGGTPAKTARQEDQQTNGDVLQFMRHMRATRSPR